MLRIEFAVGRVWLLIPCPFLDVQIVVVDVCFCPGISSLKLTRVHGISLVPRRSPHMYVIVVVYYYVRSLVVTCAS